MDDDGVTFRKEIGLSYADSVRIVEGLDELYNKRYLDWEGVEWKFAKEIIESEKEQILLLQDSFKAILSKWDE